MRARIGGLASLLALGLAAGPAAAATPAPSCTPDTFNNSAQLDGSVTVSPMPGSRTATASTQISFLGVPASQLSAITVTGSSSGVHHGRLERYSQGDGASFVPSRPFVEGETVTVRARVGRRGATRALLDRFAVAREDVLSTTREPLHRGTRSEIQSFRSRPDLRPPVLTVSARAGSPEVGDLLTAPYDGPGQSGPMILDQGGGLLWFKPLPRGTSATNLQVQDYFGSPALTWWQGNILIHGFGQGVDVIANSRYETIALVRAGNGLRADLHDFQLTGAGTALITAYHPIYCNLSAYGGAREGAITDGVMQEIDIRTGLVMMQWSALDHVSPAYSYEAARNARTYEPFDFFHINSIDPQRGGRMLLSSRNTWAVYELNGASGRIEWRLGGRRSSFAMGHGTRTAWQHDARELPNGDISIFDNGASPRVHSASRAIVLHIDQQRRSVALVSQLVHPTPIVSESQGNAQVLPNGDTLIGWGQEPDLSELSSTGELLFDAHFPAGDQSYRDFRAGWTGNPSHPPVFALARSGASATLYASWNGSTLTSSWRVLAGSSTPHMQAVASAPRAGFETAIALPPGTRGPYVTVQALGAEGQVLGTARATRALA